jgi:hypothetical protein
MKMHKDYPELVKTALASDAYWHMHQEDVLLEPFAASGVGIVEGFMQVHRERELMRNSEAAHHIGSLVSSVGGCNVVKELAWGEPIPELHKRQFVVAVEDSREIEHKADPAYLAMRAIGAMYARKLKKLLAETENTEFINTTFEEQLEAFYNPGDLPPISAQAQVDYGSMHAASIARSLYFMRKDERSGYFLAMPAPVAFVPQAWRKPNLRVIPDRPIGSVYSKKFIDSPMRMNHLGRIISAKIMETQNVQWKNKNDGQPKRKKLSSRAEGLKEKLALQVI